MWRSPMCSVPSRSAELPQARRLELGVKASLAIQLAAAGRDDAVTHWRGAFARRLGGQRLELDPPDADLQIDPVQQRTRQPEVVAVDCGWRATTASQRVPCPAAWTGVGRGDEREPCRIHHRTA